MTQYQQVIAALEKIGGKGTTDDIYKAIDGIENWRTKTPKASVAGYLSRGTFKKEGDFWLLSDEYKNEEITPKASEIKDTSGKTTKRGLYFITLNPVIKPPVAGLLFKIGFSDGRIGLRISDYGRSLPYNPILLQSFYRIPADVDLNKAEEQVRVELLTNESLGLCIEEYAYSNQREWLQTLDLSLNDDDINKLAVVVNKIVKDTITSLRKYEEDED